MKIDHRQDCNRCGYLNGLAEFILTPQLKHFGKLVCSNCGAHWKWVGKPESDASKYRRPKKHKELVKQFSKGYCEMCLTAETDFTDNQTLEGHHVIPYQVGGSSEKDNVWIICTRCHRQIELIRTYNPKKCIQNGTIRQDTAGTSSETPVGLLGVQGVAEREANEGSSDDRWIRSFIDQSK